MTLALLEWRRAVSELYTEVRRLPPEAGHRHWRESRQALLRDHPESPFPVDRRHEAQGITVAPYDPSLRFVAELEPVDGPATLEVRTGSEGTVSFDRLGLIRLGGLGTLDVWWLRSYGGGVFVPMKDGLAGKETYGGGRYLLDTAKGADLGGDRTGLIVDLNFAYNPSCAYDGRWTCPLAPEGNTITASVRAGELTVS